MLLAGPISHTSTQYIDFVDFLYFTGFVYHLFAHFSGCRASFVCSCHSVLECCVMFSGVKLSMGSFVLVQYNLVIQTPDNLTQITISLGTYLHVD